MQKKIKNEINKRRKSLKEKGITLIALVVTIIILLILAGVTLNIALSDNGLFKRAQEGAEKYKQAQTNEEKLVGELDKQIAEITGENPTEEQSAIKVELKVTEAEVTPTEIPVTTTVSKTDGKGTDGLTYEFYKNDEKDGDGETTGTHSFNGLDESTEYTLKVVVRDSEGNESVDSITIGVLEIYINGKPEPYKLRYTVGATWDEFLSSDYSKEVGGYYLGKTNLWFKSDDEGEYENIGSCLTLSSDVKDVYATSYNWTAESPSYVLFSGDLVEGLWKIDGYAISSCLCGYVMSTVQTGAQFTVRDSWQILCKELGIDGTEYNPELMHGGLRFLQPSLIE